MSSYSGVAQLPPLEKLESAAHSEVLIADPRWDQGRVRAAVDAVFAAHPGLGTVFEPFLGSWTFRPGGWWVWAVEPPGVTVSEARNRQRALFDMRIGRLFAVSLIPGTPDRLVVTASRLCMDSASWSTVLNDLMVNYRSRLS
ncbi:hypothetical protein A5791_00610 [Mycobacterium sp. 852002-51163_SCH5372311]|uniref:hypothetical protein n=1 Tax=Mycobacterium sp. 852002-51163_SCH5372311 TaxID=1834097 RepID=UPI0008003052|nr:hypothetical protein [Mycobacterium sp. 852002-51163_SCH5372311]OBF94399.1 hypothetical protein A5791_00610 [Mycobacterium sp. 852002-51163_SCH5372311]